MRARSPWRSWDAQTGVTLIEISITLAIVGILATIAVPNLSALRTRAQEETAVSDVETFLVAARTLAHAELTDVDVTHVSASLVSTEGGATADTLALDPRITSVAISSGDGALHFNDDGGLDADAPATVSLATSQGRVYTLTIYPAIGAIRRSGP